MAIQPPPPIDPPLPDFPGPNTPEAQYDDTAYAWGTAIPGYGGRVKAIGDNVYNNALEAKSQAEAAYTSRILAETATTNALSAMNFKGDWASLSGPLARPATVQHNSSVWLLMRDVANVAAEVPGVSTAWVNQTARVSSVMGRTGDVVGLVDAAVTAVFGKSNLMADAPKWQTVAYTSLSGAGADWPTAANATWWLVDTRGMRDAGLYDRYLQTATQIYTTGAPGAKFERTNHDGVWSRWRRILTDDNLVESTVGGSISTSTYLLDPSVGSVHHKSLSANTTISLTPPRSGGDQATLNLYQTGAFVVAFAANISPPIGASIPSFGAGEMLQLVFTASYDGNNRWNLGIGGRFPG